MSRRFPVTRELNRELSQSRSPVTHELTQELRGHRSREVTRPRGAGREGYRPPETTSETQKPPASFAYASAARFGFAIERNISCQTESVRARTMSLTALCNSLS